jgi:hypothetical protein
MHSILKYIGIYIINITFKMAPAYRRNKTFFKSMDSSKFASNVRLSLWKGGFYMEYQPNVSPVNPK